MPIFLSKSVKETQQIVTNWIAKIKNFKVDEAIVVALEGELGAGKTIFVKAAAKALGVKKRVKSPTFTLIKQYNIVLSKSSKVNSSIGRTEVSNIKFLYHLDCYRLKDENDLINLGMKEILTQSHNIMFIEWSDRVKKILPKKHIKIHIDHTDKHTRKLRISGV